MRTLLLAAVMSASSLAPLPAAAQVSISINFDLPAVLPPMVVIEPGVQVVPRVNEEIFFVDGSYWVRRDTRWYRSPDHRRGWVLVEPRYVPRRIYGYAPGTYRRWEPPGQARKEYREQEKHEREQARERDKHDREEGKRRGRGHDRGD